MGTEAEKPKRTQKKPPGLHRNLELDQPCLREMQMSITCMESHYYDQEQCKTVFNNYKLCNSFWRSVRKDRILKGIEPALPPPEERAKIREEYLNNMRKQVRK